MFAERISQHTPIISQGGALESRSAGRWGRPLPAARGISWPRALSPSGKSTWREASFWMAMGCMEFWLRLDARRSLMNKCWKHPGRYGMHMVLQCPGSRTGEPLYATNNCQAISGERLQFIWREYAYLPSTSLPMHTCAHLLTITVKFLAASVSIGFAAVSRNVIANPCTLAAAAFVVFIVVRTVAAGIARPPYPPGPSGLPILGNTLHIPQIRPWSAYSEWAAKYGDTIHLEALGEHIIVLNSSRVARDLLDKRSAIYSDRPHFVMAGELSGYGAELPLQNYNNAFRAQRKIVAQTFNPSMVSRYYHIQEAEARKLAKSILDDPSALISQTKFRIASIIMRVTYGYTVKGEDDPMITIPFTSMDNFSRATEPGMWMVDLIPQLKYLPEWTPGATFLRTAKKWKQLEWSASWNPYRWCKDNLETGAALTPSLCATALSQAGGKLSKEDEETLVWAASSGLGGGLDTAKAQKEIDMVVGTDRLPSIQGQARASICTEPHRGGLPHALSQDDVYEGMFFPKGAVVMPNVWHMLHDPAVYPDPMAFRPERFENSDAEMRKVTDLAFGFGRRACPGYDFAEGTVFAVVATILATSTVKRAVDERGKDILPEVTYTSGTIVLNDGASYQAPEHLTWATAVVSLSSSKFKSALDL
ncbi:predicted protein [Postia placenta Mad-698-R]|uniref:Cytochrome P450 n=1 Tax=Postia placenta MAD-698-R-SB12 TaxID=670580 RepID=A0A1X6N2J2_9APHY|nr:hypothetical protein POSPLADRAFT_1140712 [Postia placenta MAD-698-R-SB12]EED82432.1 predicted protein [Postia placenta Mad-698-R]OSX62673.1 hypothetical protein POSPLADRAFT_1140712 [Postia placenta MAD-698-R-SB12]